ncbi:septum formation initiator family protein [bacterium]|nr:septum formation initiator family protein [bacterium]
MENKNEEDGQDLQSLNLPIEENLKKTSQFKSNFSLSYLLFFLSFFGIFMYVSQIYMEKYYQIQEKKLDIIRLRLQVDELTLENERLFYTIEDLKTPEGLEKLARKKLNLIRPGEKLIRWKEKYD